MLWQQCLNKLESELTDQEINTWLRTLHGTQHDNILVLLAPNTFVYQHVKDHHLDSIKEKIKLISNGDTVQVLLQIGAGDSLPYQKSTTDNVELPIRVKKVEQISNPDPVINQKSFTNNLNTSMTFDNFVEGKSNQLAVASAKQVGENPGKSYNPLFIYGGVGLGKTHLMHAIGNKIRENNPKAKVVYLHSERFVNDMITALRTNSIDQFKVYYRTVDALLIDDIQFFAGKNRSVEEFFHTFNALLEGQKQIILTSDRYPRDVEGIDDRLRSRLNWGLTVEIEPPELETRVAILTSKVEQYHLTLPKDAAFFIAKRFRSNVRDLEGALQRVLASLRLHQRTDITLDFVHDALRDQLASQDKMVTVDNIKKTVAQHYNIKTSDLDSKRRTRSIARPRQVAMSLSKELTNHSLPEIGTYFGNRDHTTVIHACKKIKELRTEDTTLDESYRILERTLTR
ncbi:MAG: chromosomal replication initiator protein [Cocleimonas sp.]|jgi:chromosomal replication initiator protein